MGVTPTKQQLEKLKSEKIDLFQLQSFIKSIKTDDDI